MKIEMFTLNKIAGAVLFSLLLALGLNSLSEIIFETEAPEKAGMTVEVASAGGAGATKTDEAPAISLPKLLAAGDPAKGAKVAKACHACHDLTKGGPNKVGPNLWDVVERPIASHEGYAYDDSMKKKAGEKWTYESLNAFLTSPKGFVPGTKMSYNGVKKDSKRADLIAYLRSLSDNPKPLPSE